MAADPAFPHDGIAVWWMVTDGIGAADLRRWLPLLDDGERARAARFHMETDRREFIAAHALLRTMLTSCVDRVAPPGVWRFVAAPDGKPGLDPGIGYGEVAFNLSHTHGLVAVALSVRGVIGIDVERLDSSKADTVLAEEYFAPAEVQLLRATPAAERVACFFRLWTLKEAYIKAIGTGLGTPLDSFAFTFDPLRIAFAAGAAERAGDWQFAVLPTTEEHALALAVGGAAGRPLPITARKIAAQDL